MMYIYLLGMLCGTILIYCGSYTSIILIKIMELYRKYSVNAVLCA